MEELWLFGQAVSVFVLCYGAVICLLNVGASEAAKRKGASGLGGREFTRPSRL